MASSAASQRRGQREPRGPPQERRGAARPARAHACAARGDERPRPGDRNPLGSGRDREGSRVAAPAGQARGRGMSTPEELIALVESYLDELALTPELGALEEPVRYAVAGGGKRVRPLLCLATAEAAGVEPEAALPAAAALELVHNFSLVHDDLPALDDDRVRRGRPSTWAQFGEAIGILAGDALLAEALRLALTYPTPAVARELVQATLGMIGGQYLDITGGEPDLAALHRLKTGQLFSAAVACALWVAEVPERGFDFPGLEIGVAEYDEGPTGCTVFSFPSGPVPCSVDVRGGSPAVSGAGIDFVDAICLAGGSLYGLEAAAGVAAEELARREYRTDWLAIPLGAGAIILDWGPRDHAVYPEQALERA